MYSIYISIIPTYIFSFSADPRELHTFWGVLIGLSFNTLVTWTINQPTIQRVIAARTEREAKK